MKHIPLTIFALLMMSFSLFSQEFNVMSYNIRFNNPKDGENWWEYRKESVVQLLKANDLISFGVQEAVLSQMEYIDKEMPDYKYVGVGRNDGRTAGEYSAIFYKNDLAVLESGTFWLSSLPEKVSKGWDAALPRVCTYAKFKTSDEKEYWHFNTHFDHVGEIAKAESAKLIIEMIKELTNPDDVVILTGDFNMTPDMDSYASLTKYLEDAAKLSASSPSGPAGTFNGFALDAILDMRIDYIFSKNIRVLKYAHLDDKCDNGLWVSDHLPVVATFQMN